METVYLKKTIGSSVSEETHGKLVREASRRGITVSELVRCFIEQGLNNPTPEQLRRLNDRFATMEGSLRELYAMAVVNWAQVKPEQTEPAQLAPLPWMPGVWDKWKEQLASKGVLNTETGKTAYEALTERSFEESPELFDGELTYDETREILRESWKADGTWTEEEEAEYQQNISARSKSRKRKKPKPR